MSRGVNRVVANCRLCGELKPLELSHILSAFVIRWFKRARINPNRPLAMFDEATDTLSVRQDGLKTPFLCWDCEQRIGKWEREFKSRFFDPFYANPGGSIEYGPWLALFGASIVWRLTQYYLEQDSAEWGGSMRSDALRAAAAWRSFLRGEIRSPSPFDLHLLPISIDVGSPHYVEKTLETLLAGHRLTGESNLFAKLGSLLLVGVIHDPHPKIWRHTRIDVACGVWGAQQRFGIPSTVRDYLHQRARAISRVKANWPKGPARGAKR